jgi:superoxide dismutase, Fe-Mn family
MAQITRRGFVQSAAVPALLIGAASQSAEPPGARTGTNAEAYAAQHKPVPLPFDAKALRGISEKLIQSHWENNYVGASKALNTVRARLEQALTDSATPPYVYNGLKREQALRTGSVVLHELYFANLGGDGKASAEIRTRLGKSFGSYDQWEAEFRKIGQGLGGGSGWVVLGYNQHLNILENYWLADHATNPAFTKPVLVMDMYEHAYQMDYGAAAAKYIDAFFANIQWDAVASRFA